VQVVAGSRFGLRSWILSRLTAGKWWLRLSLIYIGINAPLIVLTSDAWNLNGANYTASFLALGLNPYLMVHSPGEGPSIILGTGYGALPYEYLGYLIYRGLGFNLVATSILLKLIAAAAGILVAWLGYVISSRGGTTHSRTIFAALLLNPFLIFVTSIWGEGEIYIILLLFLIILLLRIGRGGSADFPSLLLASVALALSVFTYFFTLLLLPTFLLYLDRRKDQVAFLVTTAVVLSVCAIPFLLCNLSPQSASFLTGETNGYSLAYILPSGARAIAGSDQRFAIAIAAGLALALPWLFHRRGIGFGTALLAVTWTAFSLTFFLPGDVFVILGSLVVIAVGLAPWANTSFLQLFVLQAFLIPLLTIVQLVNGPGEVSGILYWTYSLHHQDISLYGLLGGIDTIFACLIAYSVGALATILTLVFRDIHNQGRPHQEELSWFPPSTTRTSRPIRPRNVILLCSVAVLILVAPLVAASVDRAAPANIWVNEIDPQVFYPYDVATPGIYPLPAPDTYSVAATGGMVSISGAAFPLGLARDTESQYVAMNLTVSIDHGVGFGVVPVWQTNNTEVDFATLFSNQSAPPLVPDSSDTQIPAWESTPVFAGPTPVYHLNGSQAIQYTVPESGVNGSTWYFGVQLGSLAPVHTQLWWIEDGATLFQAFLEDGTFVVGVDSGTGWEYASTGSGPGLGSWFVTGFRENSTTGVLEAFVNAVNVSFPLQLIPTEQLLVAEGGLGLPFTPNSGYALSGNITASRLQPTSQLKPQAAIMVRTSRNGIWTEIGRGSTTNISYAKARDRTTLAVEGTTFNVTGSDEYVLFGKLGVCPNAVEFRFSQISFSPAGGGVDTLWIVSSYAILLPGWLAGWSAFYLPRKGPDEV